MEAKHIILIIIFLAIIVAIATVVSIIRNLLRKARSVVSDVSQIARAVNNVADMFDNDGKGNNVEITPEPKTIGGATDMFLGKILKDFPEFHNSDAENDIKAVISDYIQISHGQKSTFASNSVNELVARSVPNREHGNISNLRIHKIAIYNYQKTLDYATVTYRCAVGYKLNSRQIETRFEVSYTFQIKEQGIATKNVICNTCGAPLDNFYNKHTNPDIHTKTKADGVCPYCGTKIIRDTIMNWLVSGINEMP